MKQPESTGTKLIFTIRIWLVAASSRSGRVRVRFNSSNQSTVIVSFHFVLFLVSVPVIIIYCAVTWHKRHVFKNMNI